MLHYKTQLYILREPCLESRETVSRKAELSGRQEHIPGGNVALEPTRVQSGPRRAGCGILERWGEEGMSSLQTPQHRSPACGGDLRAHARGPLGSCSGPQSQSCRDRQFLQRHTLGEKLHPLGYLSWVHFSYISHELWPGC